MKRFLLVLVTMLFLSQAFAEEYVVIVNVSNNDTNAKDHYLLKAPAWNNGANVEPYEIDESGDLKKLLVKKAFLKQILGMSFNDYNKHWADLKASGNTNRPTKLKTFSSIKRFVQRKKGGIGYVPRSQAGGDVKIVATFNVQ